MEIALFLALTLFLINGAFAIPEIAMVAAHKARRQKLASECNRSAILIGMTAIGVLNGIVGQS